MRSLSSPPPPQRSNGGDRVSEELSSNSGAVAVEANSTSPEAEGYINQTADEEFKEDDQSAAGVNVKGIGGNSFTGDDMAGGGQLSIGL